MTPSNPLWSCRPPSQLRAQKSHTRNPGGTLTHARCLTRGGAPTGDAPCPRPPAQHPSDQAAVSVKCAWAVTTGHSFGDNTHKVLLRLGTVRQREQSRSQLQGFILCFAETNARSPGEPCVWGCGGGGQGGEHVGLLSGFGASGPLHAACICPVPGTGPRGTGQPCLHGARIRQPRDASLGTGVWYTAESLCLSDQVTSASPRPSHTQLLRKACRMNGWTDGGMDGLEQTGKLLSAGQRTGEPGGRCGGVTREGRQGPMQAGSEA